ERKLKVVPDGIPVNGSFSGVIEGNAVNHTVTLPESWQQGTLQVQARFYPSSLAEIAGALESLQSEPAGCFEQAAANSYIDVLTLQFLQQMASRQAYPFLEKQARHRLQAGYDRMLGFECLDPAKPGAVRGFGWFGPPAPPDE